MFSAFDFASLNSTIYPGWDYPPSMPNAYASPVLLLLYFVPEIRNVILSSQMGSTVSKSMNSSTSMEKKNRPQMPTDGAFSFGTDPFNLRLSSAHTIAIL